MLTRDLHAEFERRGPWVTRFVIGGKAYGGSYEAANDVRLGQFFQCYPQVRDVLELGSLEGGHTFALARHPTVKRVLALEARQESIDRARFVQDALGIRTVEFRRGNLERDDLSALGSFDAVFCVGVLYHLPEPWKLVEQLAGLSRRLFIWTHYVQADRADAVVDGYRGTRYQEQGLADPLSGLSPESFWPTLASLKAMLETNGLRSIHVVEDDPHHPHGPCVTLATSLPWLARGLNPFRRLLTRRR